MPVEPAAVGSPADSSGTKICVHDKALLLTLQLRNDFCNPAQQRWHRVHASPGGGCRYQASLQIAANPRSYMYLRMLAFPHAESVF